MSVDNDSPLRRMSYETFVKFTQPPLIPASGNVQERVTFPDSSATAVTSVGIWGISSPVKVFIEAATPSPPLFKQITFNTCNPFVNARDIENSAPGLWFSFIWTVSPSTTMATFTNPFSSLPPAVFVGRSHEIRAVVAPGVA